MNLFRPLRFSLASTALALLTIETSAADPNDRTLHEVKFPEGYDVTLKGSPQGLTDDGVMAAIIKRTIDDQGNPIPAAQQKKRPALSVPVDLTVDANRDGLITTGREYTARDENAPKSDATSKRHPFRFWINDDDDWGQPGGNSGEHIPKMGPDWDTSGIDGIRDLEDFSVLQLYIGYFQAQIASGTIKVGLKWTGTFDGTKPVLRIFRAVDSLDPFDYLKSESIANEQAQKPLLLEIKNNLPVIIPTFFWENFNPSNPRKFLLFEACSEATGELILTFHNAQGDQIGEGGSLWLDLVNVRKMYERANVLLNDTEPPYNSGVNQPVEPVATCMPDPGVNIPIQSPSSWREEMQYIVFAHGWNMTYDAAQNFGETLFKRIWQRGYKGRYAFVRWPTLTGLLTYNDSEYRAWKCGEGLKQYVNSLPASYTKNLVSHSMGGIIGGSGLLKGLTVENYAILNAAVPSICYDSSLGAQISNSPDADGDTNTRKLVYHSRLVSVASRIFSFYLPTDDALEAWELNNNISKPQPLPGEVPSGYQYAPSGASGQKLRLYLASAFKRYITQPHEAMAYAVKSMTKTVGASSGVAGSVKGSKDLTDYGITNEHSAEFNYTLQKTKPFYDRLLDELKVKRNP